MEKEIARTLATKKSFSHTEFVVGAKIGNYEERDCLENELRSDHAPIQQQTNYHTPDSITPQIAMMKKDTR